MVQVLTADGSMAAAALNAASLAVADAGTSAKSINA